MNNNKLTKYLKNIIKNTIFENNVFYVGGVVRSYLLNEDFKDVDICVTLPNGGIKFAEWLNEKGFLTHPPVLYPTYGTSMFKLKRFPDIELEAVHTRKEQYKDKNSRNPETEYGTIEEDAFRRDLTINSLFYNISDNIITDPTNNGLEDIKNHVIRVTNPNPDIVFEDDPLRIMRAIRFSTIYGWRIEHETYMSMVKNVDRLSIITHERIRDEFQKILMSKNATIGIRMLVDIGVMKYVIPELEQTIGMSQNHYHFGDVYEHTLALIDYYHKHYDADVICLLSCLLHDIGKINTRTVGEDSRVHFYGHENQTELIESILRNLKYDNDTIKEVCFITKNHMRTKSFGNNCEKIKPKHLNKLVYTCRTKERFDRLCKVIECDNMSHHPDYCVTGQYNYFIKQFKNEFFDYKLPVNGNDVMEVLGIEPCTKIKECLDWLMKFAFTNPTSSKEIFLKKIKEFGKNNKIL